MLKVSQALVIVYGFTAEEAQKFMEKNEIPDEHENPLLVIEENCPVDGFTNKSTKVDWFFCTSAECKNYEALPLYHASEYTCSKCGGKLV